MNFDPPGRLKNVMIPYRPLVLKDSLIRDFHSIPPHPIPFRPMSEWKAPSRTTFRVLVALLVISVGVSVCMALRKMHRAAAHKVSMDHSASSKTDFFRAMPIDTNAIIFIGDSHFELFRSNELFPEHSILNMGISGNTSGQVVERFSKLSGRTPPKIFIEMGVNDLFLGGKVNDVAENMDTLLKFARSTYPHAKLYVCSLLPTMDPSFNDPIQATNTALAEVSKKHNVTYIDLYEHFENEGSVRPELVFDGIHLNALGYQRLVQLLVPYLD